MEYIGIVGAGVMGIDVATIFAFYGYNIVLNDINPRVLEAVPKAIETNLKRYKVLQANMAKWDAADILSRITTSTEYEGFENVSWIIENATEDFDIKKAVYRNLATICKDTTYYGVNTSCISITKLGALLKDPSRIIGMHFMNPAPLINVVETVRGYHTSEETIKASRELLKGVEKQMILVNDSPGFVSNRVSHLLMNEAAILVQENVATPKEIDAIFKKGYAHKMGPLETADLIGLDTVVRSLDVLYSDLGGQKFKCCSLLRRMVDAGLLGVKSGQGFYSY